MGEGTPMTRKPPFIERHSNGDCSLIFMFSMILNCSSMHIMWNPRLLNPDKLWWRTLKIAIAFAKRIDYPPSRTNHPGRFNTCLIRGWPCTLLSTHLSGAKEAFQRLAPELRRVSESELWLCDRTWVCPTSPVQMLYRQVWKQNSLKTCPNISELQRLINVNFRHHFVEFLAVQWNLIRLDTPRGLTPRWTIHGIFNSTNVGPGWI